MEHEKTNHTKAAKSSHSSTNQYSWYDLADIIYENEYKDSGIKKDSYGIFYSFKELDPTSQYKELNHIQNRLKTKLQCLFKEYYSTELHNNFSQKEYFSKTEVNFLTTISQVIGNGIKWTSKLRENGCWEFIPFDKRKKLINALNYIMSDETLIDYYFDTSVKSSHEIFETLKNKVLYPQLFRIRMNIRHLEDFFFYDNEEILNSVGEQKIVEFERDLNNLLSRYSRESTGLICPYPITLQKLLINEQKTLKKIESAYDKFKKYMRETWH